MVRLKKYNGKEIEVTFNTGIKIKGMLYRYYRTPLLKDGDYEYWIGYDGGDMTLIYPSSIKEVKEIEK